VSLAQHCWLAQLNSVRASRAPWVQLALVLTLVGFGAAPALAGEFYAGGALAVSGGIGDPHGHKGLGADPLRPNVSNH
jgi:hypothetical protein